MLAFRKVEFLGLSGHQNIAQKGQGHSEHRTAERQTSLQRILGLRQYFRKYVPNYSKRTAAMRQLLRSDTKFVWSEQCNTGLETDIV